MGISRPSSCLWVIKYYRWLLLQCIGPPLIHLPLMPLLSISEQDNDEEHFGGAKPILTCVGPKDTGRDSRSRYRTLLADAQPNHDRCIRSDGCDLSSDRCKHWSNEPRDKSGWELEGFPQSAPYTYPSKRISRPQLFSWLGTWSQSSICRGFPRGSRWQDRCETSLQWVQTAEGKQEWNPSF